MRWRCSLYLCVKDWHDSVFGLPHILPLPTHLDVRICRGKRQTHQSMCSMCEWVTEWLNESALIKGRDRIGEWEHKLNPFNQTWHRSLDLSTIYGASENSAPTVIAALISAGSHLSQQATTQRREGGGGGGGSQVCGIIFSQSISQQGARKQFKLQTTVLLSLSIHPHADGKSGEGL